MSTEFDNVKTEPSFGFSAGMFFSKDLSNSISIQPELNLVVKSSIATEDSVIVSFADSDIFWRKIRMTLTYLKAPVLVKISLSKNERNGGADLYLGPYVALNVGARIKASVEEYKKRGGVKVYHNSYKVKENIKGEVNKLDYGVLIGIGVITPSKKGKFITGFRFSAGLKKIIKNYLGIVNVRNLMLSVTIGYSFN